MLKRNSTFFLAAVAILLFICLCFAPQWFHSQLTTKFNTGYLWFGVPFAVSLLLLLLHMWKKNTELKIQHRLVLKLRAEFLVEHKDEIGNTIKPRPVPAEITESKNIYHDISLRNYWAYRVLGVVSLASSLFLAVALGGSISVEVTKILAFVSSLSTGAIFSFNLVEKSNRARRSFRILLNATMLYKYGKIEMKELLERYSQAEDQLGDDEFRHGSASGSSSTGRG
jgi:hypothetical protein